jgi:membrane protease YdiL (CAAX protease family)
MSDSTSPFGETPGWLIVATAFWIVMALVAGVTAGTAIVIAKGLESATLPGAYEIGFLVWGSVILLGSCLMAKLVGHGSFNDGVGLLPISQRVLFLFLAVGFVAYAYWQVRLFGVDRVGREFSGLSLAISTVVILFIAPLSEEFFFRGWLWTGLRRHWRASTTLYFTTIIWLGLHYDTIAGGIPVSLLPVGIGLGLARHKCGSVVAPLCLHFLYNLTVTYAR